MRIAVIPSVATRLLIPKISSFKDTHPHISLNISYAIAMSAVDLSELDILINYMDGEYDGPYAAQRLLPGEVRPVCSPNYLAQASKKNGVIDISVATLLHDEDKTCWSRWFQKVGLEPGGRNSETVFADFNLLSIAAVAGHGVALCPVSLISSELERGDLVLLSDIPENVDRSYMMFTHRIKNETVEEFCLWATAELASS